MVLYSLLMSEITKNLHVHMSTTMTDCDGRMDRDYVMLPNDGEDDYDFKARVLMGMVSWSYENRVEFTGDYDLPVVEVNYAHDEGVYQGEAAYCTDEHPDAPATQRDHYAEAMGY